ncbi:MAG TPA: 2-dehydropantoate 2-reductase N-terminal domain-containing protein [Spirochaetia bacterium]|nr:2-dehydropantoate 2-reductase N-terminal domain-containing protein [Spirochaetales bacterium]HRY80820.1 2-dehydropantoate 2-reductase N-terminal domain-containing protein [Spirochaetia bacterium]
MKRGTDEKTFRVAVFGAGVIGSLYAGRLAEAGCEVAILARGDRADKIRSDGLRLEDERSGRRTQVRVAAPDSLREFRPDAVFVAVRKDQADEAAREIARDDPGGLVVPMVNAADGHPEFRSRFPEARLAFAFPGAGGTRLPDGTVLYTLVPGIVQATTLGPSGPGTDRVTLLRLLQAIRKAGFPAALERDMDAWQKTHVALVSPIADALYAKAGDHRALARDTRTLRLMAAAVREGFRALRASGITIRPARLGILAVLPASLVAAAFAPAVGSSWGETVIARHANAARAEMETLAGGLRALVDASGVEAPSLRELWARVRG